MAMNSWNNTIEQLQQPKRTAKLGHRRTTGLEHKRTKTQKNKQDWNTKEQLEHKETTRL